ncbi:DUF11 domain-containing protein [Patescibacteria group bacterium]|nr:MAG: DUF11 domain-containing protein [Patescibacteria group bacterium]
MPLDDLQKKIYSKDTDLTGREHEESQFDPLVSTESDAGSFAKEKAWQKKSDELSPYKVKSLRTVIWAVLGMIVLGVAVVAIYRYQKGAYSEERVTFEISGPISVPSNQPMRYTLSYHNDNRVSLKNVSVSLNYPDSFQPEEGNGLKKENQANSTIELGEIAPYSSGSVEFVGQFYAPAEAIVYLNAKLRYNPGNVQSLANIERQVGVQIKTSPLSLELDIPYQVASGDKVDYVVDYRNDSARTFNGVRLTIKYPQGFEFDEADPEPTSDENVWELGTLEPGSGGRISVTGSLTGMMNDSQVLAVSLGSAESGSYVEYNNQERITKIVSSPLTIGQQVAKGKKIVGVGERLPYMITYKNVGEVGLRNAIVTVEIDSKVIDYTKIRLKKGYFDGEKKMITWKAADYPDLANLKPGQEGKIEFELDVLPFVTVDSDKDRNFTIKTLAKIDSPDIPTPINANKIISSNQLSLKLKTKVIFEVRGYYQDTQIPNSGPLPPRVGQETTYTLHWKVSNLFNKIAGARVVAYLPTGARWTGAFKPEDGQVSFNERTNQVVWEIGDLKNGVGAIRDPKELVFQVGVTPQINQVKTAVEILKPSIFTGTDTFAGQPISIQLRSKTSMLDEDIATDDKFRVVP